MTPPPSDLDALRALARECRPARLGVVCADDGVALDAAAEAVDDGIVEAVLFGDRERIVAKAGAALLERCRIVEASDTDETARRAAHAAGRGEIDVLLK